jgi:GT2 family glycosyltransferase
LAFIVVDNPHPEFGSAEAFLTETLLPESGKESPEVFIVPQKSNTGFAGGNNAGIHKALELGCEFILLHNQDGFMADTMLATLVDVLVRLPEIGAVQPLIKLYPETELINSAGNNYHFLGFGYCDKFRAPTAILGLVDKKTVEIGYASGAAILLRADLLKKYGPLDEDLFLYHEDLEYSLRLKMAGYTIALVSEATFFHEYAFSRNQNKMYLMERNRFAVLVMYYRVRTLVLLFPIALALEFGLLIFAAQKGWLKEKLRVYWYWLSPRSWGLWLAKRRAIQHLRQVSDSELLRQAVGTVVFEDAATSSFLLKYIGNPILSWYWNLVKKVLSW